MTEKVEAEEGKVEENIVEKKEEGTEVVQQTPQLSDAEQRAVEYGWKPKEKWVEEGNAEEDWVPAKHFLKFGDLNQKLIAKDKQLSKQEKLFKLMKEQHLKVREQAYEEAIRTLKKERTAALHENDLVKAEAIRDQIEEEKERFAKTKALPPEIEEAERQPVPLTPPPEYTEFKMRNPWYIEDASKQDEISREADILGTATVAKLQAAGEQVTPDKVYKAVERQIRKMYPEKFGTPKSPQTESPGKTNGKATTAVKLTEEQLQVAKAFNLTPEQYLDGGKTYKGR